MKKWFFYDHDEVSGPFGLKESNELIARKPNVYAWHPSYTHWVPVSYIAEFELSVNPPLPPNNIPITKHEDSKDEEKQLITTLERIDRTIKITADSLYEIDTDLDSFTNTTQNLTGQVELAVKSIANQYTSLQKNIANIIKTDY